MKLIGICGKARSGKDTAADFLVKNFNFRKYNLANPIRAMLGAIDVSYMNDDEKENKHWLFDRSPREMMQTLGTEWMRECVDAAGWIKLAKKEWDYISAIGISQGCRVKGMVIPDIRFENEAEWIREEGTLVHIVRPDCPAIAAHSSEGGILFDDGVDVLVENTHGLEHLYDQMNIVGKNESK